MTLVVDASVAIKWVVQEEDRGPARQLLVTEGDIHAPEFLMIEVANVLRTKVARSQFETANAASAMTTIRSAIGTFLPDGELTDEALALSLRLEHPAYDCVYLACAARTNADFVTADERLLNKLRRAGGWSRARALNA